MMAENHPNMGSFWDWEAMSPFSETNDQVPLAPNLQDQVPITEAPWLHTKWPRILGTTSGWIQSCKGHCKMKWGTKTKNSKGLQPIWVNRWPEKCVTRFQWQCENQVSERTKVDYNSEYHKASLVGQTTGDEDLHDSSSFIQQIKIPHAKGQMCIKD